MSTALLTICALAQVALLFGAAAEPMLLLSGLAASGIFALLAFTRERWHSHLDMLLIMTGPGGLAMMVPVLPGGPACHGEAAWQQYWLMSAAMLFVAAPLCWLHARCVKDARAAGYGVPMMFFDLAGMQAGMALAHVPLSLLHGPAGNPWLAHASMLTGMLLGMTVAHFAFFALLRQPSGGDAAFAQLRIKR